MELPGEVEIDLEYTNGFRETITLHLGEKFTLPFDAVIVGKRAINPLTGEPFPW